MADDEGFELETWIYTGRRLDHNRTIYDRWLDTTGQERRFRHDPKDKQIVGGRYQLPVSHEDDGGVTVKTRRAEYLEPADDPNQNIWHLADRSVTAATEQMRAAKRQDDLGALTLAQVRDLLNRGLPHQRAGALAVVLQYLGAA